MNIGKKVGEDLYVHLNYVDAIESTEIRNRVSHALHATKAQPAYSPNVVKINFKKDRISLLSYEAFDVSPFPELTASWTFESGCSDSPVYRTYINSLNPPILHRKELLVAKSHSNWDRWTDCTKVAEDMGLFDDPLTIGFRLNWMRLIESKGYCLVDGKFQPLGNDFSSSFLDETDAGSATVQRHLTALTRTNISAPVQLLLRHSLLEIGKTFFDYGCGRGSDILALTSYGVLATGWDPHYAKDQPHIESDVVNLGFVVNVIEDPAERVEAIRKAFSLAKQVMSVGVMLYGPETPGKPFRDGFITSRNTFQKYFSQTEFKDYLEHVLHEEVFMVAPGIALVFKDKDIQQRFSVGRYRTSNVAARLLATNRPRVERDPLQAAIRSASKRQSITDQKFEAGKPLLDGLWALCLELGRFPETDEISNREQLQKEIGALGSILRYLSENYDLSLLKSAQSTRKNDLRLFFAMQQFSRRPPYRSLEGRLQRDIKAFFGDYNLAQQDGMKLLMEAADPSQIRAACLSAAEIGLGFVRGQESLFLHISLVERLPVLLRAYVACGLILYDAVSDVQLVKIHFDSGKLTLLQYKDFDESPVPTLTKRIKVNIRKQDYDVFEYESPVFQTQHLAWKSNYLNEDTPGFAEQQLFDEQLESCGLVADPLHGHFTGEMLETLESMRLKIDGLRLVRSKTPPDIDQKCGMNLTYRQLIQCGETQQNTKVPNLPLKVESYNALYDLATKLLDPIIEYFGSIRLTYGFCSSELSKHIHSRVAPKLDQHAAEELDKNGNLICARRGAACDFIVDDENMREVTEWIIANLPFDRLYFYGDDCPIHLSFGPQNSRAAFAMVKTSTGASVPRTFTATK